MVHGQRLPRAAIDSRLLSRGLESGVWRPDVALRRGAARVRTLGRQAGRSFDRWGVLPPSVRARSEAALYAPGRATLTPEQQALLAAKINAPNGPGTGPRKKSPGPVRIPATATRSDFRTAKERAMGLEPTTSSLGRRRKTSAEWTTRQFTSEDAQLAVRFAKQFVRISASNGSRNRSQQPKARPG